MSFPTGQSLKIFSIRLEQVLLALFDPRTIQREILQPERRLYKHFGERVAPGAQTDIRRMLQNLKAAHNRMIALDLSWDDQCQP